MTLPPIVVFVLAGLAMVGLSAICWAFVPGCRRCGSKHLPEDGCKEVEDFYLRGEKVKCGVEGCSGHKRFKARAAGHVRGYPFDVIALGSTQAEAAANLELVMHAIEFHPKLKHQLEMERSKR
ncbi:MAG: hypothetical protein KGL39_34910 [Patescibacteria group bacterium]|nr:hypothetical protein [Patescibacteria group bacterium]